MKNVSHTPTGMLLATAALPAGAQRAALGNRDHMLAVAGAPITNYDPDVFRALYHTRLDARAAVNLVRRAPDAGCIDHVIRLGERRASVISAIFDHWVLGDDARRALIANKVTAVTADEILRRGEFTDADKLAVSSNASDDELIDWVCSGADIDDDTVIGLLVQARPAMRSRRATKWRGVSRLAHARPGIRPWLAHDADYAPAASGTTLNAADGLAVCDNAERAIAADDPDIVWAYALANLIDAPTTTDRVRQHAIDLLERHDQAKARRQRGVGLNAYTTVTDMTAAGSDAIDQLLNTRTPPSYLPSPRVFALLDTADNTDLTPEQAIRLLHRLTDCEVADVVGRQRMLACHAQLSNLAAEGDLDEETVNMLRYRYDERRRLEHMAVLAANGTTRYAKAPGSPNPSFIRNEGEIGTIRVQPASISLRADSCGFPLGGRPDEAVRLLHDRIGDSDHAWKILFGIADTFNGTIAELAEAVTLM